VQENVQTHEHTLLTKNNSILNETFNVNQKNPESGI